MLRIRNTLPKLRVNFDNKKNVLIPKGFFQNQKGIYLVDIPEDSKIRTEYWIALAQNASNPSLGDKFIQFLKSEEGQLIMESRGFGRLIE